MSRSRTALDISAVPQPEQKLVPEDAWWSQESWNTAIFAASRAVNVRNWFTSLMTKLLRSVDFVMLGLWPASSSCLEVSQPCPTQCWCPQQPSAETSKNDPLAAVATGCPGLGLSQTWQTNFSTYSEFWFSTRIGESIDEYLLHYRQYQHQSTGQIWV